MLTLLTLALGLLSPAPAFADAPADLSPTAVVVGPLTMKAADLRVTEKEGYVHLMADLYPYRDAIKAAGDRAKPAALAQALAVAVLLPHYPKAPLYKVVLVEFPERDEYDAPRWDKIHVLGRFVGKRAGKGVRLVVEKEKAQ